MPRFCGWKLIGEGPKPGLVIFRWGESYYRADVSAMGACRRAEQLNNGMLPSAWSRGLKLRVLTCYPRIKCTQHSDVPQLLLRLRQI